jgi:glucose-1-phosphate thymidylyltransferase
MHVMRDEEDVLIGLPDTVWFPDCGFTLLPDDQLSFLLFPVEEPWRFDAVVTAGEAVREIQVKAKRPDSDWVWGAFRMPSQVFRALHTLWQRPERRDEYVGTLVNAYLSQGGCAVAVRAGERYFDVGTVEGYRAAIDALRPLAPTGPVSRVHPLTSPRNVSSSRRVSGGSTMELRS